MSSPSITLIGPGAIGAALAAGLVEAGHDPTLVVRTPFDRLRVSWPDGSVDVPARCVTDPSELTPADVVIVATKATQIGDISQHLQRSVRPGSVVVLAQNGVDHAARLTDIIDQSCHVLPAIPMLPSDRTAPGQAVVGNTAKLIVPAGAAADLVKPLFEDSFVTIEATDDWLTAAWYKLVMNAASGGIGVLTRRGSEIYSDAGAQQLLLQLMQEVVAVGQAEGAVLSDELPSQLQRYQIKNAGSHTTSIVVDRIAGNPTEWRERNEIVVRTARKHGIAAPLNEAVTTLMRLGEPGTQPG